MIPRSLAKSLPAILALLVCAATALAAEGVPHLTVSRADGTALERTSQPLCWGKDWYGDTILPPDLGYVVAFAGGAQHSIALRSNGTVIAWGDEVYAQPAFAKQLTQVKAIAAGDAWSVALKKDGTLVYWGGSLPEGSSSIRGQTNVQAIAAGAYHLVILKKDGTVITRGNNQLGQTATPAGLKGVKAIAAGAYHSLALKQDGTVVAWGDNSYGATDVPPGLTGVRQIAGGSWRSLALKEDGTVVIWGLTPNDQPPVPNGLRDVRAIGAGWGQNVALKNDGTVVSWGADRYGETVLPNPMPRVDSIWVAPFHSFAIARSTAQEFVGQLIMGESQSTTFTLKNTGTAPLNLGSITVDGANASQFSIVPPASKIVPAGASTTFNVVFTAASLGQPWGVVHILSNDPACPHFDLPVTGAGGCPQINITSPGGAPPAPVVGQPFSQTFGQSGGLGPVKFSVSYRSRVSPPFQGGSSGLQLSPDGVLSGTPTTPGLFRYYITMVDARGCSAIIEYYLNILAEHTSNEDQPSDVVPFDVPPDSVVTASSTNRKLVPDANIKIGGTLGHRTLSFIPTPNQNGYVTIILTIANSSGTTTRSVTFQVVSVIDAPVAVAQQIGGLVTTSPALVSTRENFTNIEALPLTFSAKADRPEALGEGWGIVPYTGVLTLLAPASGSTGGEVLITVTATVSEGQSTSSVVRFNVEGGMPPIVTPPTNAPVLNRRTGLHEWLVNIRNTNTVPIKGYELLIFGLPAQWQVWNAATGKAAPRDALGRWIVHHGVAVPAGTNLTQVVTFYNPTRTTVAIKPALTSIIVPTGPIPSADAVGLTEHLVEGLTQVRSFSGTVPGRRYKVYNRGADGSWIATPELLYACSTSVLWPLPPFNEISSSDFLVELIPP